MQSLGAPTFAFRLISVPSLDIPKTDAAALGLPEGKFTSVSHLLAAEVRMDALDATGARTAEYKALRNKALAFIKENPSILTAPWPRTGGAVYDLIKAACHKH